MSGSLKPGNWVDRIEKKLSNITKFFHYIGQIAIAVMMIITVLSSLGRFFFKTPVPGSVEVTCLSMVVMAFMLSAYTLLQKSHINISILTDFMPRKGRLYLKAFSSIVIIIISGMGFIQSIKQGIFISSTGTYTPVLHIPYSPFYYVVSIGWLLLVLVALYQLIISILEVVKND